MSATSQQVLFGIYGLAFFTFGLVMAVRTVGHKGSMLVNRMRLLAVFGLLHGVFEWLVMYGVSATYPKSIITLAVFSFLPLILFAFWESKGLAVIGSILCAVLAAFWLFAASLFDSPAILEFIGRYCFGVPAALAAGTTFLADKSFRHRNGPPSGALILAGGCFLVYGASQLVSSPVGVIGLPLIETDTFMAFTGVPVFAIRTIIAVLLSLAGVMLMSEFETINQRNLESELENAKTVAENRNEALLEALARNEHLATHDHLTGLANRRGVERFLETAHEDGIYENGIAVLHIDLDDFKQINDTLGHASGDSFLRHIADTLKANTRPDDFVGRIGGDEFLVIGRLDRKDTDIRELGQELIKILREPLMIEGRPCRCNVSIGIAFERNPDFDVDHMLLHADTALYRSKRNGKNRIEFFSKEIQNQIIKKKQLADEIFVGLEESTFFPVYQLQFCAKSLNVAGVEALARWQHPIYGIVSPAHFLKLAEEIHVIAQIDHQILLKAHHDFASWIDDGVSIPRLAVNISANRLRNNSLIDAISDLCGHSERLSFELLESIFLDDPDERISNNIRRLREMGIEIEVDDFGTGHASIIALMKLSPTRLKIDQALVGPITQSKSQRSLVKSIIDIGTAQGISVTAEGVETMEHAKILTDLGCDVLQGFALARPMPADDLLAFLSAGSWRDRAQQSA
ncbi:EAL domain-containing protein [Roseibium sp.]|uniref:EAL domain-containing protein n=1 Tax=Roseibium sp. TaxID=1936156 RepID=UPI003B5180F3